MRQSETLQPWQQVIELFQRNGLPEPQVRLRDEIVNALCWAWYAQEAKEALKKIAAYDDAAASAYLRATGSYASFDEPKSVEIARTALEGK
jgi:hypothetical protein